MPGGTEALLVAGHQELVARDWTTARSSFEAALEQEETAEALDGLGIALGWLDEVEASLRYRERAYAEFRRRRDPFQAAVIAMQLCSQYASSLGNLAASRGWLGRLERLVEQFELPPLMDAWVLLCRASLASASDNPDVALGYGREALEIAQRFPDAPGPNAELYALSEIGAALVDARHHAPGREAFVSVSAAGAEHLRKHRARSSSSPTTARGRRWVSVARRAQ